MRNLVSVLALVLASAIASGVAADSPSPPPPWAYPAGGTAGPPTPDDGTPKHVPGSTVGLTLTQVRDTGNAPDWHPDDHPAMPQIVAHGRKPGVLACAYCHLPNGLGRPENAGIAGLPAPYILQQIADFKSEARKSADPRRTPPALMALIAGTVTEAEAKEAADYFSSLKPKPWIRVVESDMAPKTHVAGGMLVADDGKEPIGQRIIEVPEDLPRTELRDSESGFVAYAPTGSIKKGEALVTAGGAGKTTPCTICHGAELKGLGPVPPLAGRSPSYLVRQLFDIQRGVRQGTWSPLMKGVVAKLDEGDMVSIAAYLSSRAP